MTAAALLDHPAPDANARHFALDPGVVFLNHGSFGACPHPVLAEQAALRARLEAEPVGFFVTQWEGLLDAARGELCALVGAAPEDLVFVPSATAGVSTVLRSLRLLPGDELLATDHGYNACRNALAFVAEQSGAVVRTVALPLPLSGPDEVIEKVLAHVTNRTRLALLDHVTSPTAVVLPIARLIPLLAARGIDTLVDGAHGPGMVPLELDALGAAYYTGNCHKWLCAPKACGFLHVRRDRQEGIYPLVISHGLTDQRKGRPRLHRLFDWTGTSDPTPALCLPAALHFLRTLLPGGLPALLARNRALALAARATLAADLGAALPCPDEMIGAMAALPLPDRQGPAKESRYPDALQGALVADFGVQVPIVPWPAPPRRLVRVSAQAYNSLAQYAYLGRALRDRLALS